MEDITDLEIHELIVELLSSERIEYINDGERDYMLIFTTPTSSERLYADFVEKQTLEKVLLEGCFSEVDPPQEMVNNFFSSEDEESLRELEIKIDGYKTLLQKRLKGTAYYKKDLNTLKELKLKRAELQSRKTEINQFSAEYYAREAKLFTLVCYSVLDLDRNRVWASGEELIDSGNSSFPYQLLNRFLSFFWGPDTNVIRKIARSGEWRGIYSAAVKTGIDIFGKSVKDLSVAQTQLLSWSMYYQSIYEMSFDDRPPSEIIEDDERLDDYMDRLSKKLLAEERIGAKNNDLLKRSKINAMDNDHVIVSASSSNYIKLGKEDAYSDTKLISDRVKGEKATYSDIKEQQEIKKKIRKLNKGKV